MTITTKISNLEKTIHETDQLIDKMIDKVSVQKKEILEKSNNILELKKTSETM